MNISSSKRVGSIWNYPLEKINGDTSPDIRKVVSFREKLLSMVDSLITKDEYDEMIKIICKISASKFINTIDIFYLIFDVPGPNLLSEVDNLVAIELLDKDILTKTDIIKVTSLMIEIQNRLLYTARNFFTEISKSENEVEYIENMLEQLKESNSDYVKTLEDAYNSWIDNTFTDIKVKRFLQEKNSLFVKEIIKMAIQILNIKKATNKSAIESYSHNKKAKFYYNKIEKK